MGLNNQTQYSSPKQIPGTTWKNGFTADSSTAAIKTDGTFWSWGYGAQGQLGQNSLTNRSSPAQIPGTSWASFVRNSSQGRIASFLQLQ